MSSEIFQIIWIFFKLICLVFVYLQSTSSDLYVKICGYLLLNSSWMLEFRKVCIYFHQTWLLKFNEYLNINSILFLQTWLFELPNTQNNFLKLCLLNLKKILITNLAHRIFKYFHLISSDLAVIIFKYLHLILLGFV